MSELVIVFCIGIIVGFLMPFMIYWVIKLMRDRKWKKAGEGIAMIPVSSLTLQTLCKICGKITQGEEILINMIGHEDDDLLFVRLSCGHSFTIGNIIIDNWE